MGVGLPRRGDRSDEPNEPGRRGAPALPSSTLRTAARYAPDLALRKLISRFLEHRLQKQLDAGQGRLASLKKAIPPGRNGDAKLLRDRIGSLESWNSKARALLPIARTFLKLTPL